ncbi:MAG: transposase, partial [Desulfopila sp.]
MTFFQRPASNTPFSTEHACVTYLFQKRWPWGFKCPFCQRVQKDMAPAYTVVCRYCRKQTSITAHTLMHGSKKNLVAWMRVA